MQDDLLKIVIPLGVIVCGIIAYLVLGSPKKDKMRKRIHRIANRKSTLLSSQKTNDVNASLRRKNNDNIIPVLNNLLNHFSFKASMHAKLERAGMKMPVDIYITLTVGLFIVVMLIFVMLSKPPILGFLVGFFIGILIPRFIVNMKGARRIKKFLLLFPDAIDFIVRGLRSGLPVTESMNMVGGEMAEPIGSVFSSMGESIRLGVPVDKALQDMANKLKTTEFNFFVTSIILQRETGGNLSEILNNLSDVLRKRFMMRMKIKAMSSEAKASAMIVGSLPFIVMIALMFTSPGYLDPLIDDPRGNMAAAAAVMMLLTGVGTMVKMSRFEI